MKLHSIPPRVLSLDGKAVYDPAVKTHTADIAPKKRAKAKVVPSHHVKKTTWTARKRAPNETPSPYVPVRHWNNPYRPGDGEVVPAMRPGADDHKQWKSFGHQT